MVESENCPETCIPMIVSLLNIQVVAARLLVINIGCTEP